MAKRKIFLWTVFATLVLNILELILDSLLLPGLSGDLGDIVSWSGYGGLYPPSAWLYYGYYVIQIVVLTMLARNWEPARALFALNVLVFTAMGITNGVVVSLPPQVVLANIKTLLTGAVLYMLFDVDYRRAVFGLKRAT